MRAEFVSLTSPLSPRTLVIRIQTIDVRLHLFAGSFVDDLTAHDAAGIGLTGSGWLQIASDVVYALPQDHLNDVGALLEHHDFEYITGFGVAHGNGFIVHGIYFHAPQIKTPPGGAGQLTETYLISPGELLVHLLIITLFFFLLTVIPQALLPCRFGNPTPSGAGRRLQFLVSLVATSVPERKMVLLS